MRYRGQGHEIAVPLPTRSYRDNDAAPLREAFESEYRRLYSPEIPGVEVEICSWVLLLSALIPSEIGIGIRASPRYSPEPARIRSIFDPEPARIRSIFDPEAGEFIEVAIHDRRDLNPGAFIPGPAVIVEDETSTVVSRSFDARVNAFGYIELTPRES